MVKPISLALSRSLFPDTHSQELQKCFDVKDVQMLQDAISKMDPTVSTATAALSLPGCCV